CSNFPLLIFSNSFLYLGSESFANSNHGHPDNLACAINRRTKVSIQWKNDIASSSLAFLTTLSNFISSVFGLIFNLLISMGSEIRLSMDFSVLVIKDSKLITFKL